MILEDECRCLLMLNNYIFVHGQMSRHTFDIVERFNNILNTNPTESEATDIYKELDNPEISPLWLRTYGEYKEIEKRILNPPKQEKFCTDIVEDFHKFINNNGLIPYTKDELKIVIGHCIQYWSTIVDKPNRTFTELIHEDNIKQVIRGPAKTGKADLKDLKSPFIFGISMECPHDANSDKIFKVDIGSSRGFDNANQFLKISRSPNDKLLAEKQYIFSRTPQLLKIQNNQETIIKSKLKNTRIQQPRTKYESLINSIPELQLDSENYKKKYLKYKNKYLQLKKLYN